MTSGLVSWIALFMSIIINKDKKIIDTEKLKYSANLILLKTIINCLIQRTIYLIESVFCRLMI